MLNDRYQEENVYLTNINGNEYDLLEYKQSIYSANLNNGMIEKVLLENSEYNKAFIEKKIPEMDHDYFQLTWGANPQPNISGNKFTYYTNRNALKGGSSNGEIWLKNLDTGEDCSLGEIGYECLGWDINDNVYYTNHNFDIISINTNNREKNTVLYGADPRSVLLYPFIVFATDKNDGFAMYNITGKTTEYIYNDELSAISGERGNPAKTAILFQNDFYSPGADKLKAPDTNLGICNIYDKTIRFLNLPENNILQGHSWVNNEFISIVLHDINTKEENTYLIDVSYFKDAEKTND